MRAPDRGADNSATIFATRAPAAADARIPVQACDAQISLSHKALVEGPDRDPGMRHGCEVAISGDLAGPGHREPAPFGRHPSTRCRCSFRRLRAVQASSHSLSHAARPRRDIMVSFWQVLSCPNTGSTVRARIL